MFQETAERTNFQGRYVPGTPGPAPTRARPPSATVRSCAAGRSARPRPWPPSPGGRSTICAGRWARTAAGPRPGHPGSGGGSGSGGHEAARAGPIAGSTRGIVEGRTEGRQDDRHGRVDRDEFLVNRVDTKTQGLQRRRAHENERVRSAAEDRRGGLGFVNHDVGLGHRDHVPRAVGVVHRTSPRGNDADSRHHVGRNLREERPCVDPPLQLKPLVGVDRMPDDVSGFPNGPAPPDRFSRMRLRCAAGGAARRPRRPGAVGSPSVGPRAALALPIR